MNYLTKTLLYNFLYGKLVFRKEILKIKRAVWLFDFCGNPSSSVKTDCHYVLPKCDKEQVFSSLKKAKQNKNLKCSVQSWMCTRNASPSECHLMLTCTFPCPPDYMGWNPDLVQVNAKTSTNFSKGCISPILCFGSDSYKEILNYHKSTVNCF